MKSVFYIIIIIIFSSLRCISQKTTVIHLTKYSQEQGLGTYNVHKVYEDRYGFIWSCTQDGLYRFDGKEFVSFKKGASAKRQLCGADIRAVAEDTINKQLWVLPGEYGFNALDPITSTVTKTVKLPPKSANDWNLSMILSDNKLYIGQSTGVFVYNIKTGGFKYLNTPKDTTGTLEARSLYADSQGNIWVSYSGKGIAVYNPVNGAIKHFFSIKEFGFKGNEQILRVLDISGKQGMIFLATTNGMRRIVYQDYNYLVDNRLTGITEIDDGEVSTVYYDKTENIYVSVPGTLYKFDDYKLAGFELISENNFFIDKSWLGSVKNIIHGSGDVLWLACQQGLAKYKLAADAFRTFDHDKKTGIILDHVRSIFKWNDKKFLVGLLNDLVEVDVEKGYSIIRKNELFHHIFSMPDGEIHLASSKKMYVYEKGNLIPLEKKHHEFVPYTDGAYNSHVFIGDSLVVLGSEYDNGILIWNYKRNEVRKISNNSRPASLKASIVNNLFLDTDKRLWILSDNIITIVSNNFIKFETIAYNDPETGIPLNLFFDVKEAGGFYWVTSYGTGLLKLDKKFNLVKVYKEKDGLCNSGTYQVYPYKNSILITTNNGISILNTESDSIIHNYYKSDGLQSNGFDEVCGYADDRFIYAGGQNGFTEIDFSRLLTNFTAPKLYINSIEIKSGAGLILTDTSNLMLDYFNIPSYAAQTKIHFSAISFINPERITFKYKIEEQGEEWFDNGTKNYIDLPQLAPGKYHISIQAFNESGTFSEIKTLTLRFLPKWHQTLGFKFAVGFLAFGLIYAFYRYRISQIKKQQKIRKDISTDLHDDIGSTLNSVKIYTHLAQEGKDKDRYIEMAKQNLEQASIGLRDMIWVLDDKLDTADELLTRIKQFALPLANAMQIETDFKCDFDVQNKIFSKEEKRNLLLICKEAINNCVKYSSATMITVHFAHAQKKIKMIISDNGKGFDINLATAGNGLKNMQYRAKQIGYKCSITSEAGSGTSVAVWQE